MTYTPTYLRLSHRFDGALLDGICQRVGASALVRLERVLVIRLYGGSEEEQTSNYAEDVQLLARICAHHWCPLDAWHRFQVCARLAEHLAAHWAEDRHLMVLDAYIELSRELLHIDYPDRALARAHLAHLLLTHFHMTEENSSLEEAILLERDTLALRQPGHPDRGISCGNLAVALTTRFLQTRDSALLDQIIVLEREALELNPDRARSCTNLASSLRRRFEQTGERAVLDEAIILQREGMDLRPIGHPHRSVSCGSLAISLKLRFELETKPNIVLLNEAIKLERETVGLCPTGHPDRAVCCANLADSLTRLLDEAEDQALLDEAIRLEREVLELRPAGHPGRAIACLNLAASLKRRLGTIASGASADPIALMEASELLREALVHHPMGHPGRWRCLDELAQLAILHYNGAVAIMHLQEILASPVYDDINTVVKSVVDMIGRIDVETVSHQQRQELLGAYSDAIGLVSLAASFAVSRASQLQHIHHGRTLGSEAYLLAIRVDDLPTGLQLLERARGVIWSQIIHMRDPQLDDVPQELAERLQRLISGVATPASAQFPDITLSPTSGSIYTQRREVQDVIRQIRSLPGLDDFMRGPDAGTLLTTATQNPVVVLIAGETECHALVLPSAGGPLVNIVLPHVNRKALQALNFFGRTAQNRGSTFDGQEAIRLGLVTAPMKSHVASYDCLAKLWRTVVKPVITHLGLSKAQGRDRPRIHWCPTDAFAFAPIHAAGVYSGANQECCADYLVSSYTPTLAALLRAQEGRRVFVPARIKLLAIAAEFAGDMPPLRYVARECEEITRVAISAGATSVDAARSSKSDVIRMLDSVNVVHFACHGIQHRAEPHKSRFCLSSGDLTVSELMKTDLDHAFLAFLSACETAKGDTKHVDEVVHLAATMLFAGFESVVATMWAMGDQDGPFVAKRFYEELFENGTIDVNAVPYALDEAVTALRNSGAPPTRWATFIHLGA